MKNYLLDTNICVFLLRGMYEVDQKINHVGLNRSLGLLCKRKNSSSLSWYTCRG